MAVAAECTGDKACQLSPGSECLQGLNKQQEATQLETATSLEDKAPNDELTCQLAKSTSDLERGKLVGTQETEDFSASAWAKKNVDLGNSKMQKEAHWQRKVKAFICAWVPLVQAWCTIEGDDVSYSQPDFARRAPWLRAALLGAQDGLISVASLMIGVGAVKADHGSMFVSGLAGLVAGACSMAIGEFVSVHTQRDIEEASINSKRAEYAKGPESAAQEQEELAQVYVSRGLSYPLAKQVAAELCAKDPIKAHARDELGIDMDDMSNPFQAALASGLCFISGAAVPLLSAAFITEYWVRLLVVVLVSTAMFVVFGALGAWFGGARIKRAAMRTTVGGLAAIAITFTVLWSFGVSSSM